jgi:hypothetical protein
VKAGMKRKISSSPKHENGVSRVKLNNSTATRPAITSLKKPSASISGVANHSNGVKPADKQNRTVVRPASIANRRKPLAASNTKKASEDNEPADKPTQAAINPATGMVKLKKRPAWDTKGRLSDMEQLLPMLQGKVKNSDDTVNSMKDLLEQEHSKSKHCVNFLPNRIKLPS